MKKEKISFRIIGDSGPLMISWYEGPKGNAIESKNEVGVGFFSPSGELLAVEFDDVNADKDRQVLEFENIAIELKVKDKKVFYTLKKRSLTGAKKKTKKAA